MKILDAQILSHSSSSTLYAQLIFEGMANNPVSCALELSDAGHWEYKRNTFALRHLGSRGNCLRCSDGDEWGEIYCDEELSEEEEAQLFQILRLKLALLKKKPR